MSKIRNLLIIFIVLAIASAIFVGIAYSQNGETIDPFENIDYRFILLGIGTGLLYSWIGWVASGEEYDTKKFLRTFAIATLISLGLDVSNVTVDIWSASLEPAMITVFLEKLLNSASRITTKSSQPS